MQVGAVIAIKFDLGLHCFYPFRPVTWRWHHEVLKKKTELWLTLSLGRYFSSECRTKHEHPSHCQRRTESSTLRNCLARMRFAIKNDAAGADWRTEYFANGSRTFCSAKVSYIVGSFVHPSIWLLVRFWKPPSVRLNHRRMSWYLATFGQNKARH